MDNHVEKLWSFVKQIRTCMLVSQNNFALRARPMTALPDQDRNIIRFIADRRAHKDEEIESHPEVCLAFSAPEAGTYVSISGTARVETRAEAIREHWDDAADAWFEHGADDENAILIEVSPTAGEYWDAAGTIAQSIELVRANVSGDKPDLDENEKVLM